MVYHISRKFRIFYRMTSCVMAIVFFSSAVLPPTYAQGIVLPVPGTMVTPSVGFVPPMLKGMTVDLEHPFQFDFILDSGNADLEQTDLKKESEKLIRYFLASLTIPEDDLWVNLSPYEKDRIIPSEFAATEMGRDLLAQDYILKQLTASLMYPEEGLGKDFWDRIYSKAQRLYGTTQVPVDTFHKIWIVPDKAVVYEHQNTAFVLKSHLKVMMEEDYLAMRENSGDDVGTGRDLSTQTEEITNLQTEVMREIILPEIEKEVNQGKNFAQLRQVYHSLILAKWYKERLKASILNREYSNQKKINGVDLSSEADKEEIYQRYLEAFKKGVFDYIKEDYDDAAQQVVPRRYFSGGMAFKVPLEIETDSAMLTKINPDGVFSRISGMFNQAGRRPGANLGSTKTDLIGQRGVKDSVSQGIMPGRAVYNVEAGERFDDIVINEIAKKRGISVDDLEADFERTATMMEEQLQYTGFIEPGTDKAAQKIHDIFDRLIAVYKTKTNLPAGEIHVVDANTVNAFVIRKRKDVYFYKGLYETLYDISQRTGIPLTEDVIAFVIAHELGHSLQNTAHEGLDVRDFAKEEYSYLLQMIKNAEYDADMRALELMDKAGYSVFGAIDAIKFLEFITNSSQAENVLSSHPYISLRKHRLSQIILDQNTMVFKKAKALRTQMPGFGRMNSRDADFRNLMDKSEEELFELAQNTESLEALDELAGMIVLRRHMNALKGLINEKQLKESFLRHVYIQAAMAAILSLTVINGIMPGAIDYSNMKSAAAVYDFGKEAVAGESVLSGPGDEFEQNISDIAQQMSKYFFKRSSPDVVEVKNQFEKLFSVILRKANGLGSRDFDNFLLPFEEVEDLIPIFKEGQKISGISVDKEGKPHFDRKAIEDFVKEPKRLISAFFYATYLGQKPSVEIDIPTTDVKMRLQRKNNALYLENPAYRSAQSGQDRKSLQNIVLLHYAMEKAGSDLFRGSIGRNRSLPGIDRFLKVPQKVIHALFVKYYEVMSRRYPKFVAVELAKNRIYGYFDSRIDKKLINTIVGADGTPDGFVEKLSLIEAKLKHEYKGEPEGLDDYLGQKVNEFINGQPLIIFIKNAIEKYGDRLSKKRIDEFEEVVKEWLSGKWYLSSIQISYILSDIAAVYSQEPQRDAHASELFLSETWLDYYFKEQRIDSLSALLTFPDWAVSDYLDRHDYGTSQLIKEAMEKGMSIQDIFTFMRTRLSYSDRRKVFEDVFFGHGGSDGHFLSFLKETLKNDPKEIIVWFLAMFSRKDALELMDTFVRGVLSEKAKEVLKDGEAKEFREMAITLFEYLFAQTSKNFYPDEKDAKVYLDLINQRIEESGKAEDEDYVRGAVYGALMVLSRAVDLKMFVSRSETVSEDSPADFKSKTTSIVPEGFGEDKDQDRYFEYQSSFALHNYGWNDSQGKDQSVFVAYLTRLSLDQLKDLLRQRLNYIKSKVDVEYRGDTFSLTEMDDFFSNLITVMILKKLHDPDWGKAGDQNALLDDLFRISVAFRQKEKEPISIYSPDVILNINEKEINSIPFKMIKSVLAGDAIPSQKFDSVWEDYVKKNGLEKSFPDIIPFLLNPNAGNEVVSHPASFLAQNSSNVKVSYRSIVKKVFMDSSVYSRLFNAYVRLKGRGYVYGKYKSLSERLQWLKQVLPSKSIIKDGILDLWETDIFPEIIDDLPNLVRLVRDAASEEEDLQSMWTLLGEMDDDVGRLKRLSGEIDLAPERIHALLDFYMTIIPLALSPQKIARYGATAYLLWSQLPGTAEIGLSQHLEALTKFMPEPSVLRDELLMKIGNRYIKDLKDAPLASEKLYVNNLLSRNKDLRSEDFVSETLLHLFGGATIEDKRDVLMWIVGARGKPDFVVNIEDKYSIDFTTLPADVKLLPATIREKFIEAFMLGDNGVLDPQSDADREVMEDFLEQLFIYVFPADAQGIGDETRSLLSRIFLVVMKTYPPYRRVQIIKALAALRVRSDFERTSMGERLAVLLGVLGPVGIKVAQYLSENETLVPDDNMRSSLGALRHKAPEITKISAVSVLENEIPSAEVVVREIGEVAGIASIKQVDRGRWLDIEKLSELIIAQAGAEEADDVRDKMSRFQNEEITFSEIVSYLTEKAQKYEVDLEKATVRVVFKIRRPNMETTLGLDYMALDAVAKELEGTVFKGEPLNISDLVHTVREWVELEKNFYTEVNFHDMLTALDYTWVEDLAHQAGVTIGHPRILFKTESLIVEEEIPGIPLVDLVEKQQPVTIQDVLDAGYSRAEAGGILKALSEVDSRQAHIVLGLKKAGFSQEDLGELTKKMLTYDYGKIRALLREMLLHQLFVDGVFHADLHQGNVLLTPDGRLVMIDRGNVGTLNKEQIEGAKTLLKGLSLRQAADIKQGIDRMFLNAQGPDGVQSTSSKITEEEIQQALDKGYDLKMTMNIISADAIRGTKNTPAGKEFSTFLKAFTQAMWLFPTDLSNGMATLQTIADYISMSKEEAERAAQEQAKYFVFKDVSVSSDGGSGREENFLEIAKWVFQKKMGLYMRPMLESMLFCVMSIPLRVAISKSSSMKGNMLKLVRTFGRRMIEENIDEFIKRQDLDLGDAAKDMLSVQFAESILTAYVKSSMEERLWSKMLSPVVMPVFKGTLFLSRSMTRIYVEAAKEWIDTVGKRYIEGIAPRMTVREAVDLLAQIFGKDFSDIKQKLDKKPSDVQEQKKDGAMLGNVNASVQQNPGGIDFNPDLLKLELQGEGAEFVLPQDTGDIEQIHIEGLMPVIINITPVTNLPAILGASVEEEEGELLVSAHDL